MQDLWPKPQFIPSNPSIWRTMLCFDVHRRRQWWWCSETYRAPEHWLRLGCKTCDIPQSIIVGKSPPISRTELEVYRRRRWWCNGTYKDSKHWLRLRCKTYVTYTTIHYKQPTHLKHNVWKCTKEDNFNGTCRAPKTWLKSRSKTYDLPQSR